MSSVATEEMSCYNRRDYCNRRGVFCCNRRDVFVAAEEMSSVAPENMAQGEMSKKWIVRGLSGVAVDRHGLILWENGATGARKVFRCLLDLWEAIF